MSSTHIRKRVTRRDVLQYVGAGMGLAALGPASGAFLRRAEALPPIDAPFLVVINLFGGNDSTNMVVPTHLDNYYTRRNMDPMTGLPIDGGQPSIAIPPGQELSLLGGPGLGGYGTYGLHPSLSNIQGLWNQSKVAIVNKVGYPTANLSHFTSQDIYSLGVRNDFSTLGIGESGWVARFADLYAPTGMGCVGVGVGRPLDFEGGSSTPLLVSSLGGFQFLSDNAYANNHLVRLEVIKNTLSGYSGTGVSSDIRDALDQGHTLAGTIQDAVSSYSSSVAYEATNGTTYNIHRYMQDIARLVQHGAEDTRIFYTGFGGFDTHGNQGAGTGRQADLLDRLDTAIGAFHQDVTNMGVADKVVVVVISEFARRNFQNGSGGTDHGHGAFFLLLGDAVNGGMYGPDLSTTDLDQNWLGYEVDFRDIYRDVLSDHLGTDPAPVFPEPQPLSNIPNVT